MEKYKLRDFAGWSRKQGITDQELNEVLAEMRRGLLGDSLGANVYKKRIATSGRGKRGGARTILLFRHDELAVFLFGYAKNEKSNLLPREQLGLRVFAKKFLKLSAKERADRLQNGALVKLKDSE